MKIKQELQIKYVFTVEYREGSNHVVPDILSRNPIKDPESDGDMGVQFGHIPAITSCLGIKDRSLEWIERESEADERYKALHKAVLSGFDQFKSKYTTRTKRNKCRTISNRNQYIEEFRPQW